MSRRYLSLALVGTAVAFAGCGADDDSRGGRDGAADGNLGRESQPGGGQASEARGRSPSSGASASAPGTAARVSDVVDGDTIELHGMGPVRLIGVDTPEWGDCGYDEATEFTQQRVVTRVSKPRVGARAGSGERWRVGP